MDTKTFIGLDIGRNGGIAILKGNQLKTWAWYTKDKPVDIDMPFHILPIYSFYDDLKDPDKSPIIVFEDVRPRSLQHMHLHFKILYAVLGDLKEIFKDSVVVGITTSSWRKYFELSNKKDDAAHLRVLYKEGLISKKDQKTDDEVEAALIARAVQKMWMRDSYSGVKEHSGKLPKAGKL